VEYVRAGTANSILRFELFTCKEVTVCGTASIYKCVASQILLNTNKRE